MKYPINNASARNIFLHLLKLVNDKNNRLNLQVKFNDTTSNSSDLNDNIFFQAGQLLMFFYIFNIQNLKRNNIKYFNNTFYINDLLFSQIDEIHTNHITSEDIINYMIENSIFTKEVLPLNILDINDVNLNILKEGFKLTYETLIDEKINILHFLNNNLPKNQYPYLFNTLKILSPHDLSIQLEFINLKYRKCISKNKILIDLLNTSNDYFTFIQTATKYLDIFTQNAFIGSGDYGIELMWIGFINNRLQPIKEKNIYISLLFAYIGKLTDNTYYIQTAKHAIHPLLKYLDFKNKLSKEDANELIHLLYLLNFYIHFDTLNKFITDNNNLFDSISPNTKLKYSSSPDEVILNYIYTNLVELLPHLIIKEELY